MKGKKLASHSVRLGISLFFLGVLAMWLRPSGLLAGAPANLDWQHYGNDQRQRIPREAPVHPTRHG